MILDRRTYISNYRVALLLLNKAIDTENLNE